jgi:hypothetical protein
MKANKELLSNPSAAVIDKEKNKDSDEEMQLANQIIKTYATNVVDINHYTIL